MRCVILILFLSLTRCSTLIGPPSFSEVPCETKIHNFLFISYVSCTVTLHDKIRVVEFFNKCRKKGLNLSKIWKHEAHYNYQCD